MSRISGTPVSQGIAAAGDIADEVCKLRADTEDPTNLGIELAEARRATDRRDNVFMVSEDCHHVRASIQETLCHLCCKLSSKPLIDRGVATCGAEGSVEEGEGEGEMSGSTDDHHSSSTQTELTP